ncbi:unnamed protein product, partial [Linum tenue]
MISLRFQQARQQNLSSPVKPPRSLRLTDYRILSFDVAIHLCVPNHRDQRLTEKLAKYEERGTVQSESNLWPIFKQGKMLKGRDDCDETATARLNDGGSEAQRRRWRCSTAAT